MSLLMQSTEIRFWNWLIPIASSTRRNKINQVEKSTKSLEEHKLDINLKANEDEQINVINSIPFSRERFLTNQNIVVQPSIVAPAANLVSLENSILEVVQKPSAGANTATFTFNPQLFMILSSSSLGFFIGLMISIFM